MFSNHDFDIPKKVNYNQFEVEEYTFKNKAGIGMIGKRTTRQLKTELFPEFKSNFDNNGAQYLLHRYECKNNNYVWPQILDSSPRFIFHLDYSENISATPKFEPQNAHFAGKQTSLHCSVVHHPENQKVQYAYQLSDDNKHDFAFTEAVVCDLIVRFDISDVIRIKSDNCQAQLLTPCV